MPGNKNAYRLYSADGHALIDLLQKDSELPPAVGQKVLCRHPFQESKRAYVIPSHVESLYKVYWKAGKICQQLPTLEQVREKVQISLKTLRNDHKRTLNPTPYKVGLALDIIKYIYYKEFLQSLPRSPSAIIYTTSYTICGCRMRPSESSHDLYKEPSLAALRSNKQIIIENNNSAINL